jgi:catechol 2,3-dioxygenase-like lactoylglutathione lyase family enzyme
MRGALHHIEIYVHDLRLARDFWGWLLPKLGYKLQSEWARGFDYMLEETYLVFVQTEERFAGSPYHRCRAGLNHLAFHGGTRAEVDALTSDLRAHGVKILYEDRHPYAGGPDYYAVFFEDPMRMKVEVVASD